MATYIFSQLGNGQSINFNPVSDVFIVDNGSANAATISGSGNNTVFTLGGKTININGLAINAITSSVLSFTNGTQVQVGDTTTSTDLDDLGNTLNSGTSISGSGRGDLVIGRGGNDVINANEGNDVIYGNQGNDSITGSANQGNDTVYAGADNDTIAYSASTEGVQLFGDKGNDSIVAGSGADLIQGGEGDDIINTDGAGIDTVYGGQGNDSITLNADSVTDSVSGDKGNDTITGGSGGGTVLGGEGNDSISGGAGINNINGNQGDDTILGGTSIATSAIRGGAGNDSLVGGTAAALQFFGDLGNDTFVSGTGGFADTVIGGAGNDSFLSAVGGGSQVWSGDIGDDTFNLITGNIGSITITGGGGKDSVSAFLDSANANAFAFTDFTTGDDTIAISTTNQNASQLAVTYNSGQVVIQNGANDSITISGTGAGTINVSNVGGGTSSVIAFNNSSTGASLAGGAGADVIISGDAGDTITAGAGADSIIAGNGNDRVVLTPDGSPDTISGGAGADTLEIIGSATVGNLGTNITGFDTILFTGAGSRTIDATASYAADVTGPVTIDGSAATGVITVSSTANWAVQLNITGGSANDVVTLTNNTLAATVTGGAGNDSITGSAGANILIGGVGLDTIIGAAGADTLTGGTDADVLTGSGAVDQFRFASVDFTSNPSNVNQIDALTDWTNTADKLAFEGVTSGTTFSYVTDATAANGLTLAALLALATNDGVTVVNLTNAQNQLDNVAGNASSDPGAGENFLIIKSGATKNVVFLDGTTALNSGNFDFAGDFVTF